MNRIGYWPERVVSRVSISICVTFLMVLVGCMEEKAPPPEGRLAVENVAKWYQLYRQGKGGKTPPDEKAFVQFVGESLKARGTELNVEELLTSPRDKQRFVVRYGKPNSTSFERNVVVHEQEGYNGKKLMAFESAVSQEVDDAELQALIDTK